MDTLLTKNFKANEAPLRESALLALCGILQGCGVNGPHHLSEIKKLLQDKVPEVRVAAVKVQCKRFHHYSNFVSVLELCVASRVIMLHMTLVLELLLNYSKILLIPLGKRGHLCSTLC